MPCPIPPSQVPRIVALAAFAERSQAVSDSLVSRCSEELRRLGPLAFIRLQGRGEERGKEVAAIGMSPNDADPGAEGERVACLGARSRKRALEMGVSVLGRRGQFTGQPVDLCGPPVFTVCVGDRQGLRERGERGVASAGHPVHVRQEPEVVRPPKKGLELGHPCHGAARFARPKSSAVSRSPHAIRIVGHSA